MGRYDGDESSIPDGMEQIGYDSETRQYQFRDADGAVYEGADSGGNLTLVSRPGQGHANDEPIRLMPNAPIPLPAELAHSPASGSQMSFHDFLPPSAITSAPPSPVSARSPRSPFSFKLPSSPKTPSSLRSSTKSPTSPTSKRPFADDPSQIPPPPPVPRAQTTTSPEKASKKTVWNVVRSVTLSVKMRRSSTSKSAREQSTGYEQLGGEPQAMRRATSAIASPKT